MKKIILFIFAVFSITASAGTYDQEIAVVVANNRAMIAHANEAFDSASEFQSYWNSIRFQLKILNLSLTAFSTKPITANESKTDYYNRLTHESVFTVRAVDALKSAKNKINENIIESQRICSTATWLCKLHQEYTFSVTSQLNVLESVLVKRRSISDAAMKQWQAHQLQSWIDEQKQLNLNLLHGIEIDKLITRVPLIFLKMNNRARLAILLGHKEEALDLLKAVSWFRSIMPVFFTDKILTESAQYILDQAIKSSENVEEELRQEVSRIGESKVKTSLILKLYRTIASGDDDDSNEGDDEDEADNTANQSQNLFKGWSIDVNGSREYQVHGRPYVDFIHADKISEKSEISEKVVNGYEIDENTPAQSNDFNVKPGDQGVVRIDGGKIAEAVKVEKDVEVKARVEGWLKENIDLWSGKVIEKNSETNSRLSDRRFDTGDRVMSLLSRAEPKVKEENRISFAVLKRETESLQKTTQLFERVVADSVNAIQNTQQKINLEINDISLIAKQDKPDFIDFNIAFPSGASQLVFTSSLINFDSFSKFVDSSEYGFGLTNPVETLIVDDVLLEMNGVPPSQRVLGAANGKTYHDKKIEFQISNFESEVKTRVESGKKLSPNEVLQYTTAVSKFAQEQKIKPYEVLLGKAGIGFGFTLPERVRGILEEIARFGIGFTPAGALIDFHNLVTGRDFFTGQKLSNTDLVVTGIGLVAGQGMMFRALVAEYNEAKVLTTEVNIALTKSEKIIEEAHNVTPLLGNQYVRNLPELVGQELEAFEGLIFQGAMKPGEIVFQAQRTNQTRIGQWFTPVKPINAEHAEDMLNIAKWKNDSGQIKAYRFKESVSGYAGKVAGGSGNQFFIPKDVPLDIVLEEIPL